MFCLGSLIQFGDAVAMGRLGVPQYAARRGLSILPRPVAFSPILATTEIVGSARGGRPAIPWGRPADRSRCGGAGGGGGGGPTPDDTGRVALRPRAAPGRVALCPPELNPARASSLWWSSVLIGVALATAAARRQRT